MISLGKLLLNLDLNTSYDLKLERAEVVFKCLETSDLNGKLKFEKVSEVWN